MIKLELNTVSNSQPLEKTTKSSSSAVSTTTANPASEDRTTFHSDAKTVQSFVSQALATPDVRQEKIDALKQSISDGSYKFDANKVADAMIADHKES